MMNTANYAHPQTGGYTTVEMLLEDVSRQMAISNPGRFSRGSSGQKPANSMRVVKPSSASNSPRGSMGLGRRKTVMNDGAYRRRLAMLDQNMLLTAGTASNDGLQVPYQARASRPMSWHPASHTTPQQYQSYAVPSTEMYPNYQPYDTASTSSIYSGYGSPDSNFSSLSVPYMSNDQGQYYSNPSAPMATGQYVQQQQHYYPQHQISNLPPQAVPSTDPSMFSHFDWNNFATNGFENASTTPPTPENFLPVQHAEPMVPAEDAIPYHSLDDGSDDGEELIGMGLYDAPEICKSSSADPQLDNYRAYMMSSLMGSGYAPPARMEPTGKGLKLEETWTPLSDDEDEQDEDEDDDEQDGEGEAEEEPEIVPAGNNFVHYQQEAAPTQRSQGNHMNHQAYARDGWL